MYLYILLCQTVESLQEFKGFLTDCKVGGGQQVFEAAVLFNHLGKVIILRYLILPVGKG